MAQHILNYEKIYIIQTIQTAARPTTSPPNIRLANIKALQSIINNMILVI
jgi:hypothetical protein